MSITQNLPQHFAMLAGLQRQKGKGLGIYRILALTFEEMQICLGALQALTKILFWSGGEPVGDRGIPVNPLPDPLFGCLIHIHHSSEYFMGKSKKCAKKLFHFPLICAIMSKIPEKEWMNMPRTSDKADLILDYVNQFVQENGYAPSVREIGAAVGLRSTASVSYHLQALQDKGLLQAPNAKGLKRAIVTSQRPGQIPVVGVVTAGVPILAVENQEGTMAWDGDPSCFALRVRGDSMINAGILSGDKVVVRPQQTASDGEIVVAMIGDEATVKRLRRRNGQVWLMPENDNYDPIDGSEAVLVGLVKAVVREY